MRKLLLNLTQKFLLNWKKLLTFFIASFVFVYFVSIAIAPYNKFNEFNRNVSSDTSFTEGFDSIYYQREISFLVNEKAYKEALLKLSESDSIQLIINLSDSMVYLSIKGVIIHQTKVNEYKKDKLLNKLSLIQEVKLFSEPLSVKKEYATIVKEPIVIRHAPKDTLEASLNAWKPDTLIQNPAFVSLCLDYGIQIIFEQDDNKNFYDKWKSFMFYNQLRIWKVKKSITNFFCLKKQQYTPTIIVKMPVDDLRAIYRAMPNRSLVVLKL